MLITTSKILPLLTKLFFKPEAVSRSFHILIVYYYQCFLNTILFDFITFFIFSKYFLMNKDENVTFITEVRRGTKMLNDKYMRSRMTNEHVGPGSMSIIKCVIYCQWN